MAALGHIDGTRVLPAVDGSDAAGGDGEPGYGITEKVGILVLWETSLLVVENTLKKLKTADPGLQNHQLIQTTVQSTFRQMIVPHIQKMTTAMEKSVDQYIQRLSLGSEMAKLIDAVHALQMDMNELKEVISGMALDNPQLTEQMIDEFFSERKINEILITVCKKKDARLTLYSAEQLTTKHVDLIDDARPELVLALIHVVCVHQSSEVDYTEHE